MLTGGAGEQHFTRRAGSTAATPHATATFSAATAHRPDQHNSCNRDSEAISRCCGSDSQCTVGTGRHLLDNRRDLMV